MYEHYDDYQKHAMLTHVSLFTNSTYKNIDVSPEVDYVFQFSLDDQNSKITIFKTQMKPEIEIPKWMEKWVEKVILYDFKTPRDRPLSNNENVGNFLNYPISFSNPLWPSL